METPDLPSTNATTSTDSLAQTPSRPSSPIQSTNAFYDDTADRALRKADGTWVAHQLASNAPQPKTPKEEGEPLEHINELPVSSELRALYTSFQKCLNLRDKYIALSRQRLEDDPKNYDGKFNPEPNTTSTSFAPSSKSSNPPPFEPWQMYPPPPKRHWDTKSAQPVPSPPEPEFDPKVALSDIPPIDQSTVFSVDDSGIYQVYKSSTTSDNDNDNDNNENKKPLFKVPTIKEYYMDMEYILSVISSGPAKSFAWRRLNYLESKWDLYSHLNEYQELSDMKGVPHRDFYNVRKVDTHIHHSACMNQKHLLRFIKSKMRHSPDEQVIIRDGKVLTLAQVFESLNLTAYQLSIDTLDMHAHQDSFHRFDTFNLKYNPVGDSRLREIFLKTDNFIQGKYLAEMTKEVMADLQSSKYQMSEYRISIYGRSIDEWDKLADFVVDNALVSHNVRWLIQIPRLYDVYKTNKTVESFADIVRNVFEPLFEATKDPSSHPKLHIFLQRVIGFDSVDDESKAERRMYRKFPLSRQWTTDQNPPYSYWIYYLFANMASLNNYRHSRGFNTFVLRPHSGEAGDTDHLTAAFLTSHSISHGILLRKVPALQYLFYLKQIGIAMSPLSNNALFLAYDRNPFNSYFRKGLNVSLSTDDPLMLHLTKEPLLEEYSVAAQIYKLSPADMCELARNSCLQSGFEMEVKRHWLGDQFYVPGVEGNSIQQTNVPNVRLVYRNNTLQEELEMVRQNGNDNVKQDSDSKSTARERSASALSNDRASITAAAAMASMKLN